LPGGCLPAKHPREALLNLLEALGVDQVLAVDHAGLDAAIEDLGPRRLLVVAGQDNVSDPRRTRAYNCAIENLRD
jgi:hypothetical protein